MGGSSGAGGADFYNEVAAKTATPGGGSVAAAAGALGAALTSMVCRLTVGKKKYKDVKDELNDILEKSETLRGQLKEMIAEDGEAGECVMFIISKGETDEATKQNSAGETGV